MSKDKALRVAMVSLGCPKNLVDSEKMLALLAEDGCVVGAPMERADVVVVNTCGFLAAAREESLGVIREALEHKAGGRVRRVVVAGCLSSRDGKKLYELAPGIDAVVGVNDRQAIAAAVMGKRRFTRLTPAAELNREASREDPAAPQSSGNSHPPKTQNIRSQISNHRSEVANRKSQIGSRKSKIENRKSALADSGRFRLTARHSAYLRIAEGCSQRCTFCTIPSIRGPFRSKPPQAVLDEARELIADGATELNIIAQDTTGYGQDLAGDMTLAKLLARLDELEGVRWIRLMYTYPRKFTDELIDVLASARRIVHYVDLPLQHLSDPVLRRMGRGVTLDRIATLIRKLRDRVGGIAIRTTFIVGFPGETEGQFEELLHAAKSLRFDALGVFAYSAEEGTPAAAMPRQVPEEVKADRVRRLMLAQQKIAFTNNRRKLNRRLDVLVDGMDADGRCIGRYYGQAPDIDSVCILTAPRPSGSYVRAQVCDWNEYDLIVRP